MDNICELCNNIKASKKCSGCSAQKFDGCECMYCGTINEELKALIDKLISVLKNKNDYNNEELVNLYSIKDLNIEEVNIVLTKNNFYQVTRDKIDELFSNRYGSDINDETFFITLIDSDSIEKEDKDFLIVCLMRFMVMDKLDVTNENKKLLIKYYTEFFMGAKINNPEVIYTNDIDAQGDSLYNMIRFNEKDVDKLLEEKDYVELLRLIFHECTHTYQKYHRHKGDQITGLMLMQTKEEIISKRYPEYYNENYIMYLDEVEARYTEYRTLIDMMRVFGLKMSDQSISVLNEEMIKEEKNMEDRTRVINGNVTTVDEIFDTISLSAKDINNYPLLKLEYKIENNQVIKKSDDELIIDYNNYLNRIQNDIEKEHIDYLYKNILGIGEYKKST